MNVPAEMLDQIITGDNVEVMRRLPDGCIDLTVTSPPYDGIRTFTNGSEFNFEGLARELWRVTKPGGVVVWIVGDETKEGSETGTSFRQVLYFLQLGFSVETMIYEKANTAPTGSMTYYLQAFEFMFVLSKGKPKTTNHIQDRKNKRPGAKSGKKRRPDGSFKPLDGYRSKEYGRRTNVWQYGNGRGTTTQDGFVHEHPAIFPDELAKDHILSWSKPGEVILDPFMGSGTTAKMCIATGRHFIGIDVSEKYCQIARRRVAEQREKMIDTWERGNGKPGQPVDTAELPLFAHAARP